MKKAFLFGAALIFCGGILSAQDYKAPENDQFRIIGYVPSYKDISKLPDHAIERLDIACYAFASIESTGMPVVRNEKQLKKFSKRARKLGVDVMLSFNGRHKYYADMVASPKARERFINEIWRVVKKYRLAGVDNDWEYPLGSDGSGENNLVFMKELARRCREGKKQYFLTAAITPGKYIGNATAGIPDELFDYVDWFNVMVYDDYSEREEGRHHSTYDLMLESVGYWVGQRGLPLKKFVVGMPAYGVPSGIMRSGNTRDYAGIIREGGSCMGDVAMISSIRKPQPYPVYYNGIKTIREKTRYAAGNNLGGIMFWEVMGDRHDDLSLIGAACDEAVSCGAKTVPPAKTKHGKRK